MALGMHDVTGGGKPAVPVPGLARVPRTICGDFHMRIARDGSWHYQGSPIGRRALVCLFASVLKRDEEGVYWLETPVERGRVEVEDAPFVAVELNWGHCCSNNDGVCEGGDAPGRRRARQCLTFRTNLDEMVTADVIFSATGVTNGSIVKGLRREPHFIETETILMRSKTGSVRRLHYRQRNQ